MRVHTTIGLVLKMSIGVIWHMISLKSQMCVILLARIKFANLRSHYGIFFLIFFLFDPTIIFVWSVVGIHRDHNIALSMIR
jgi:hypothetical protein